MKPLLLLLAFLAMLFPATGTVSSIDPKAKITITGDFVPQWCVQSGLPRREILNHEILKPVTVPWHSGITVMEALNEAGLQPLYGHSVLGIASGGKMVELHFDKTGPTGTGMQLSPGARIGYWALAW